MGLWTKEHAAKEKFKQSGIRPMTISEQNLLELEANYQMNSAGDLAVDGHYWKLDNTHLSPETAARQIMAHFRW